MSKQVNFFITPNDYKELFELVDSDDNLLLLKHRDLMKAGYPVDDFISFIEREVKFYLSKELLFDKVVWESDGQSKYIYPSIAESPIIEFGCPRIFDQTLKRGRIYFTEWYHDRCEGRIKKEHRFLKWANRIFRNLKKSYSKIDTVNYASKSAIKLLESGYKKMY